MSAIRRAYHTVDECDHGTLDLAFLGRPHPIRVRDMAEIERAARTNARWGALWRWIEDYLMRRRRTPR